MDSRHIAQSLPCYTVCYTISDATIGKAPPTSLTALYLFRQWASTILGIVQGLIEHEEGGTVIAACDEHCYPMSSPNL